MKVSNPSAMLTKMSHCIDKLNFLKSDKPGRNVSNRIFLLGCFAVLVVIILLVFYVTEDNTLASASDPQLPKTLSQAPDMMPIKKAGSRSLVTKMLVKSAVPAAQSSITAPIHGHVPSILHQVNTLKPLQTFSHYIVQSIEHDKGLSLAKRNAYLVYAKQLEQYVQTATLSTTTDHKIRTLADELKVTTMQGQISSQRAKIAQAHFNAVKAEVNASKIQKTALQPVQMVAADGKHIVKKMMPTFHFLMTYLSGGHWVGVVSVGQSRVTVHPNTLLLNGRYKVQAVNENRIMINDMSTHKVVQLTSGRG